jgi:hypothetical protein
VFNAKQSRMFIHEKWGRSESVEENETGRKDFEFNFVYAAKKFMQHHRE